QIREILISESAWEEMTCLFAPSLSKIRWLDIRKEHFAVDTPTLSLIDEHRDPWVSEGIV
ncbi:hypothetical protein ACJEP9_25720, partial [Klebsiella pneumoniae]